MRDVIDDLGSQVMRVRCCHFGLKCAASSKLPSGSHLQVGTTCTRIPTKLGRCTCQTAGEPAQLTEPELDQHGQGAQKAEWRKNTLAIMTGKLMDQMDLHETKINHTSAIHARVDKRSSNLRSVSEERP
eukprot:1648913-Pyramimonas_sp.AAC.1